MRPFFLFGDDGDGVGLNTDGVEADVVEIPLLGEEVLLRVVKGTAVVGRRASSRLGMIRSSSSVEVEAMLSKTGGVRLPSEALAVDTGMRLMGRCVVLETAVALVVRGVVDVLGLCRALASVVRRLSSVADFGFTCKFIHLSISWTMDAVPRNKWVTYPIAQLLIT